MNKENFIVILDNSHGVTTAGHHSPLLPKEKYKNSNLTFLYEYEFSRNIVEGLEEELTNRNIEYEILSPEIRDVELLTRANRLQTLAYNAKQEDKECILISVHLNVCPGDLKWQDTFYGWCVSSPIKNEANDKLINCFNEAAKEVLSKYNKVILTDDDINEIAWFNDYKMFGKADIPFILTANFYMDNLNEVDFLLSEEGKRAIIDIHIKGIEKYINSK